MEVHYLLNRKKQIVIKGKIITYMVFVYMKLCVPFKGTKFGYNVEAKTIS
ncbi:hypothetical protein Lalb_Chr25g0286801 [Lupinus albus]|uniref:Uncharacterized protein n=1 Tax=Lupinus albus TaxID=3870 RepID=A0A6A4N8U3_LUPAL|nr:hypothetical protein Lalb_Chr25g0286801 [Lupinus albus]